VKSEEENRANFCKILDGISHFNALYCMCTLTLNELKAVSARAKHSDAIDTTSSELMAQDDFQEVPKRKRHNSSDTSQSAKKSTKPVPTSASVKRPPNPVSIRKFFAPLRTTDMGTETTGAENTLLVQGAPRI
jgi:hypothetical protein